MPHMDGFIPVISYWSANRVAPREGRASRNCKQSCVVVPARMGGVYLSFQTCFHQAKIIPA